MVEILFQAVLGETGPQISVIGIAAHRGLKTLIFNAVDEMP
jgi:hypothetical protein